MPSWSVVLAAVAAIAMQAIPARDAGTARQGSASIKGRVVDGTTKAPLSGARVRLIGSSPRGPVLTDDAGAFVFDRLPEGTYSFVIERNGYRSTSWPDASRWIRRRVTPITLAAADNVEGVTLAIERGGVVAGKVMSARGEPISGAQVSLAGVAPPTFTRNGTTNDLGDYRVADLPPGRYVLHAHLRGMTNDPSDTPLSGPLPTYYPGTLVRSEARELVVGRGGQVTEADLRLVEGRLSLLDVTVTHTDGRPADSAMLSFSSLAEPSMQGFGRGIRNGVGRLELPPGEYTLQAQAPSALQPMKDRIVYDLAGMARVRLTAGAREAVTVVVGMNAIASGRIVFEGDRPPPTAVAGDRVPIFASNGQTCRYGSPTVASDWSFRIDGLSGTCRSVQTAPLTARWVLKSVILEGREVLDDDVWFEPGRQYENVRIVMTDRRSQVRVRVSEANGMPTGEYAAVAFPVQRERWRIAERYIRAAAPLPPSFLGMPDPSGTGGEPGRSLRFIGLPPGDYYLIAVDDIEHHATRDPAVLEKLARLATRVTIPEQELIEVALQRYVLSDAIR
jgi:Carboxypeptidase regulatory-like domain